DLEEKKAREAIKKQLKDIKFINKLYDSWKKKADGLLQVIVKNQPIKNLLQLNYDYWEIGWNIEYFDPHGVKIVNEYLDLSDEEKAALFYPTEVSNVQKERLELLQIIVDGEKKQDILEHQQKYYYIKCSWADGSTYTIDDIRKKILYEKESGIQNIKKEISKIKKHHKEISEKKKGLMKKLAVTQKNIAYFFQKMTDWREERKIISQKVNNYIHQELLRLEKKTKIPLNLLKFMDIYNYEDELDINLLYERSRLCANLLDKDGKFAYYTGNDAKQILGFIENEFFRDVKVVTGLTGNKGKVKGRVSVVMEAADFTKFEKGDILVTAMTRPEFVPIMKKAAAIVTDEGGITCHAAIVSRELGIPCVLGTNVATSFLKDGMIVEVDADNGKVKIIPE
ncbi:TPA: hypothetical protein HA246_05355, partial [Candidatus Woesearchaeota archaeon]|nr:hypothetical protein [Candidatus Woesearchaeota archaeon]